MRYLAAAILLLFSFSTSPISFAAGQEDIWVQHTYEVKLRLKGIVSTTQVQANDSAQAKKLAEAQYGKDVTVLSTKKVR